MAKISIIKVLQIRNRWRILTVFASLVVIFLLIQLIVNQGPKQSMAAGESTFLITVDGYITPAGQFCQANGDLDHNYLTITNTALYYVPRCDAGFQYAASGVRTSVMTNQNVVIDGAKVVVWGAQNYNNLTLKNGAILTHAPLVLHTGDATTYTHKDSYGYDFIEDVDYYKDTGETDFNLDTGILVNAGTFKKVDITVKETAQIDGTSKIDVTGKGYPGGSGQNHNQTQDDLLNSINSGGDEGMGMPLSYGGRFGLVECYTDYFSSGSGGGGYSYAGGKSKTLAKKSGVCPTNATFWFRYTNVFGGARYGENITHGPGGGAVGQPASGNYIDNGGSGGGYIRIDTKDIVMSDKANLIANGIKGKNGRWAGGGGAGGRIDINVSNKFYLWDDSGSIDVSAVNYTAYNDEGLWGLDSNGQNYPGHFGNSGAKLIVNAEYDTENSISSISEKITARGAGGGWSTDKICKDGLPCAAGGGSGGLVKIILNSSVSPNVIQSCNIAAGDGVDYIPAACEKRDVSISNTTVDASKVKIWESNTATLPGGVTKSVVQNSQCAFGYSEDDDYAADTFDYTVGRGIYHASAEDVPECDTERHFASLTLKDGAVLTHRGVTIPDMNEDSGIYGGTIDGSLADNTMGSARWKKVDLIIANDLVLNGGSKVAANGKGYPGNPMAKWDESPHTGYGPHKGVAVADFQYDAAYGSGGGGYSDGGPGGISSTQTVGTSGGDRDFTIFEYGSGGGGAKGGGLNDTNDPMADGGNGGGRIRISADQIIFSTSSSTITADGSQGEDAEAGASTSDAVGAGGGGGSIFLTIGDAIQYTHLNTWTVMTTKDGANIGTGNWQLTNLDTNALFNIRADGGKNGRSDTTFGNGGGGRIIVQKHLVPSLSIYKKLSPISRAGIANTSFNPYALQKGDIVRVGLTLGTFTGAISVEDEYLKLPDGSAKCVYLNSGSYGPDIQPAEAGNANPIYTSDPVTWEDITMPEGSNEVNITYYCQVQ